MPEGLEAVLIKDPIETTKLDVRAVAPKLNLNWGYGFADRSNVSNWALRLADEAVSQSDASRAFNKPIDVPIAGASTGSAVNGKV